MELTILGSGTCVNGLPNIKDRQPPGFILQADNNAILLECSEGIRFRINQAGYEYTRIKDLFISHAHPDHFALVQFIQSVYVKGLYDKRFINKKLNIYCSEHVKNNFIKVWRFHLPELAAKTKRRYYEFPRLKFILLKNGSSRKIGNIKIKTALLHHGFGKSNTLGIRFEWQKKSLVFLPELGYHEEYAEFARDADLLLCESAAGIGEQNSQYGHLNPYQAGQLAKKANARELVLYHYYGVDKEREMIKNCRRSGYRRRIVIAKDFQRIKI